MAFSNLGSVEGEGGTGHDHYYSGNSSTAFPPFTPPQNPKFFSRKNTASKCSFSTSIVKSREDEWLGGGVLVWCCCYVAVTVRGTSRNPACIRLHLCSCAHIFLLLVLSVSPFHQLGKKTPTLARATPSHRMVLVLLAY